ncbi:MAG: hypothetical protein HOB20_01220, partial [Planctomycetaceae bacterium]|nr:hypothetical protein [Planctomycetaceae bacterium]
MKLSIHPLARILILVLVVITTAVRSDAQEPTVPRNPEYQKLVELLGDPSFQVRERAHETLAKIGMSARRGLA